MRQRDASLAAERTTGPGHSSDPLSSTGHMHPSGPVEGRGLGGAGSGSASMIQGNKLTPAALNQILMECLLYLWNAVLVFYPVYLTGYLGLNVSWVLLCMMMITLWKKNRQWKDVRIGTAIDFVDKETHVIHKELKKTLNMATWVHFPDVEKVQWLNKVVEQAWPFFGMFMEKLLKEKIQPAIRLSSPALKTFTFTKVHFGHIPLKITGMKVFTDEVDKREVILDMHISYDGDVDIDTEVKTHITAGVKGLKFHGMLRVILEPLIGEAPLVGGVTLFFIRRPTMQINWTGMTNLLNTPAFRFATIEAIEVGALFTKHQLFESTIIDIIASMMVLPNRMCIPLIDQVKVAQMRFPLPRGVLRVHLLEARDLVFKVTRLVKGKCDPYAVVTCSNKQFKSKTVKKNLHPHWDEVYEFVVHEAPGQVLEMELFDEDTDKDDFLGRYHLDVGEVKRDKEIDQWFCLEGVQSGEVHLKLQWMSLQTDQSLLKETTDGFACAMLAVYLDTASNIPKDDSEFCHSEKHGKHSKEARLTRRHANPNSYVEFSIDEQVQKSKVAYASKDPVWEEGFTFFVHTMRNQHLCVKVKEHEKKTVLGTLNLSLDRLLNASDMTLDQRFMLERSGSYSQIKMKASLRIVTFEKPPPKIILDPPPPPKSHVVEAHPGADTSPTTPPLSSPSSPHPSTSAIPAKASLSPSPMADSTNGLHSNYVSRRHDSFAASNGHRTAPATPRMRRYDSHSLLSENSIASSRLDLSEGHPYPEAIMNHQGSFGEIQLTVRYAVLRKKLIVLVNSCRNLFPWSENGTDSYVRLYLLPDQTWRHRLKTQVKRRTVNPIFNEKFEYDVSLQEAATRKLDVSVKKNRMFHTRERKEIGQVLIDLSQLDLEKGFTQWYELTLPELKKSN